MYEITVMNIQLGFKCVEEKKVTGIWHFIKKKKVKPSSQL